MNAAPIPTLSVRCAIAADSHDLGACSPWKALAITRPMNVGVKADTRVNNAKKDIPKSNIGRCL